MPATDAESHAGTRPHANAGHEGHDGHGGHDHGGHAGHDAHAGHDPEMFRRRFWLSLLLTIPLVVTSEMVMDWFGYEPRLRRPGGAGAGARLDRVLVGRLAVPGRRGGRGPRPPAPG